MWILVIQEKVAMLTRALSTRRSDIPGSVDNIDDITRYEASVVSIGRVDLKLIQRHGVQSLFSRRRDRASGILWTRSVRSGSPVARAGVGYNRYASAATPDCGGVA